MLSVYGASYLFAGQLKRYNENPTVLSIEILSLGEFEKPSFTVCSNHTDNKKAAEIVQTYLEVLTYF